MTYDPFQTFAGSLAHGRDLELGPRGGLMAIINVTPDSFSDGGQFIDAVCRGGAKRDALHWRAGAEILDIGGESTRPDAEPVSAEEEQARILPVIAAIAR